MEKGCPFIDFKPCAEAQCYFYWGNKPVTLDAPGKKIVVDLPELQPSCILFFSGLKNMEEIAKRALCP